MTPSIKAPLPLLPFRLIICVTGPSDRRTDPLPFAQVITGYFLHPDREAISRIPVGITPSGTANAMGVSPLHIETFANVF